MSMSSLPRAPQTDAELGSACKLNKTAAITRVAVFVFMAPSSVLIRTHVLDACV
jgi:hypothetical protein